MHICKAERVIVRLVCCDEVVGLLPKIFLAVDAVLWGEFADNSAWIACGEVSCGNIARYYRACADNAPFADGYATANGDATGNPTVGANDNGLGVFPVRQYAFVVEVHIALVVK